MQHQEVQVYQAIVTRHTAIENCKTAKNEEWELRHGEVLRAIMRTAPSGSGFDSGTRLVSVSREKIIFATEFHHLDVNGSYTGWTSHKITVRADLLFGFRLTVSGPNTNGIKEYIHEVFATWLQSAAPTNNTNTND